MRESYFKYSAVRALLSLISALLYTSISSAATTCEYTNGIQDNSLIETYVLKNALPKDQLVFYLFSNGHPGELFINDKWLDAPAIKKWLQKNELLQGKEHLYLYGCHFAQSEKGKAAITYLKKELNTQVAASTNLTGSTPSDWTTIFGESRKFDSTPSTFVSVVAGTGGRTSLLLKNVEVMAFVGSCTWATVNRPLITLAVNATYILIIK